MKTNPYLFDEHFVRYQLARTNPGNQLFNWLFIPGGPGADSSYFLSLVNNLELPGNFWLIDFPGNGNNISDTIPADFNFESWSDYLLPVVQKFENPILVGHSFGAMFPLLFPELECLLKGFIILNSAPSLWLEESLKMSAEKNIPRHSEPIAEFEKNPNPETFKKALLACTPYYFPKNNLEEGKKLFEKLPFNYHAAGWWLKKVNDIQFNAQWIPQKVPTLIMGSSEDYMTPSSLFKKDKRFFRENIRIETIENAGHFPWIDQPSSTKELFELFFEHMLNVAYQKA